MRSPLRIVLLALAFALGASACGSTRAPAAVVDGERITDAQLADQMVLFTFLGGLNQQSCGTPDKSVGESASSACARFTLSNLIQEDLVKHYATAHDITIPDSDVTDAISRLESSLGGADKLDQKLKQEGVTRLQFTTLAHRLLLFSAAQRAIGAAGVTDQQLRAAYEQQKLQFTQIHASHILVKTRAEAKRIASEATPTNFAQLAKKYSTDTASGANGGDLGAMAASSLDSDFVNAALALSPGQISGPVHTQFGWHVIMLQSVDVQPFDQVKDQLSSSLQSQAFTAWIQGRLSSAEITVNPKYGRLDTQTGEVVPIRSTKDVSSASATPEATATSSP
jgi:parvulin-like peptidyl-prolyl isomerase